ncbi:MAG: hydrogen gas-evolving membrane-bound hydrogenase subunit E [Candidatus Nanohalobium sp.]
MPPDGNLVLLALFSPFIASLVIGLFYRYLKDYSAYIGAFSGLISLSAILSLFGSKGVVHYAWIPSMGIGFDFYIDGLSLLMATLASGIGVLIFLYSRAYMDHGDWKRKYYAVLTAFMGSMIGLVLSSNMVLLFLFWEFTSVCSFLLISHNQRTDSGKYASKKSLLITVGSGILLLIGVIILGNVANTYSIAHILSMDNLARKLASEGLYIPVLLLIGIGAAAKSAQVPLHIWLPDAMEAPTPVSAFLHSATMVKAGVYLIARFRPVLMNGEAWNMLFVTLGLITMTAAAVLAVAADELKELLAYSTASHLGLIVAGLGLSTVLGAETAVFHLLNHAVFKASLFMVAGIVLHEAGTQKIEELSGLRKEWPVLAAIATVSGLSMAGVPPLNGFFSKELLFESTYHVASHSGGLLWILPFVAVLGSVFTFLYSLRFISVFYGDLTVDTHEIPKLMLISPGILAFLALMIGLFPNSFIEILVNPALKSAAENAHGMSVHLPAKLKPSFVMSLITIGTGLLLYKKEEKLHEVFRDILRYRYLRANYYYHSLLDLLDHVSDKAVDLVETGLLRTYAVWVLTAASVTGITGYLISGGLPQMSYTASLPVSIVLVTMIGSAYAVLKSETYIASVLTLSILGFMVSIYYLLMDAPDLVMTQLVVETLSLIIFLLVLNNLPDFRKKISFSRKARDIVISSLAGLTVFLSVVYSTAKETPHEVAKYYIEHSLPGSGGGNIVNVILVDFRGLDTMGEISVIAMAGLSVFMLFQMRRRGEKE